MSARPGSVNEPGTEKVPPAPSDPGADELPDASGPIDPASSGQIDEVAPGKVADAAIDGDKASALKHQPATSVPETRTAGASKSAGTSEVGKTPVDSAETITPVVGKAGVGKAGVGKADVAKVGVGKAHTGKAEVDKSADSASVSAESAAGGSPTPKPATSASPSPSPNPTASPSAPRPRWQWIALVLGVAVLLILVFVLLAGRNRQDGQDDRSIRLDFEPTELSEVVGFDNDRLTLADGRTIRLLGLNYLTTRPSELIEDAWNEPDTWDEIEGDFDTMSRMGANAVRLHLQFSRFMIGPLEADPEALANLDRLITVAEQSGLYLVITGLGSYRPDSDPAWYRELDQPQRWDAQEQFWAAVAGVAEGRLPVIAFDLMNEPIVNACPASGSTDEPTDEPTEEPTEGSSEGSSEGSAPCDWVAEADLGGFHFVQRISREQAQLSAQDYVLEVQTWMESMGRSIRTVDAETALTVGHLRLGEPGRHYIDQTEFTSLHVHLGGDFDADAAVEYVRKNSGHGDSVMLTESGTFDAAYEDYTRFIAEIDPLVSGLFMHYIDDVEDLEGKPLTRAYYQTFNALAADGFRG